MSDKYLGDNRFEMGVGRVCTFLQERIHRGLTRNRSADAKTVI
jgi:hypothetical protein